MIRKFIRKVINEELDNAKQKGYAHAKADLTAEAVESYMDKHKDVVIEIVEGMAKEAAKEALGKAIDELRIGDHGYYSTFIDTQAISFVSDYINDKYSSVKQESVDMANKLIDLHVEECSIKQLKDYIADPEQLKFIIGKINEFQVSSTGSV